MQEQQKCGTAVMRKRGLCVGALLAVLVFCCPLLVYAYFSLDISGSLADVMAGHYLPQLVVMDAAAGEGAEPLLMQQGGALNAEITVPDIQEGGREFILTLCSAAGENAVPFQYELELAPVDGMAMGFAEGTPTLDGQPLCVSGTLEPGAADAVYRVNVGQAGTFRIHLRTAYTNQTIRTAGTLADLLPQQGQAPFADGTVLYLTQNIEAPEAALLYDESTGYPTLELNGHSLIVQSLDVQAQNADTYALMEIRNGRLTVGGEVFELPQAREMPALYGAGGTVRLTFLHLGESGCTPVQRAAAQATLPQEPAVPAEDGAAGESGAGREQALEGESAVPPADGTAAEEPGKDANGDDSDGAGDSGSASDNTKTDAGETSSDAEAADAATIESG